MLFYEELPSDLISLENFKPVVFLSGTVEGHDMAKSHLLNEDDNKHEYEYSIDCHHSMAFET